MASNRIKNETGKKRPPDDAELILKAAGGDREAFGRLVAKYQDRVFNLAFRLTGRHHAALDLSQDAWMKAYAAISGFRGEAGFFTWLYRIVLNRHMNRERSLARKKEKKAFSLFPLSREDREFSPVEAGNGRDHDPSRPLQDRERDAVIQEALMRLDPVQREAVLLRDMEELSYEEVARIMAVPVGTVKSRLHRARDQMRVMLEGRL